MKVEVTIDVAADPVEVFAYWSDWTNNPSWQNGMKACTWTSEPPMQVGSTYDQEAAMAGKAIISSFVVTEFVPDTLVRIETTKSTIPLDITREVKSNASGGTTLHATICGGPTGFMRVFNPIMEKMVRRNVTADYERLKAHFA